jgi:hypothetical protein
MRESFLERRTKTGLWPQLRTLPRLSIEHLWGLLALAGILWFAFAKPLQLLDFWWHLKVGEIIYTTKSIPRTDLFSFTAAGRDFVHQNWLSELLYYLTYRLGDLPLLICLNGLVIVIAFGLVFYLCWEASRSLRIAAACTILAEVLSIGFTNARPQVFSFPLFALYLVLQRYRRRRGDLLWLLPLLMALWVNVHGAFVLGLMLLFLVTCSELVRRLFGGGKADVLSYREIGRLALVCLLALLMSGLNPEGYGVFSYVRTVQNDPASQKLVTEWQSPSLRRLWDVPFFAALFLNFLVFIYSTKRLDFTELSLFCVFAWLGLTSVRQGIWFAMIMAPILAGQIASLDLSPLLRTLSGFLKGTGWTARESPAPRARAAPGKKTTLNVLIAVIVIVITLLLSPWIRLRLPLPPLNYGLVDKKTPLDAVGFIQERHIQGHIFHPQHYGDYMIWSLYPGQKVFIDGRVHLYGEELCRDYIRILNAYDWENLLAKYQIQLLLLDKTEEEQHLLGAVTNSDRWESIYEDELSVIYRNKG